MNKQELTKVLIELLEDKKPNIQMELSSGMAESRQILTQIKNSEVALKNSLESIKSLPAIVKLRQENAAYKYAMTYRMKDDAKEYFQRKFEEALASIELGINTFDNILRNEDLISVIANEIKNLESSRHKRNKKTIEETEQTVQALEAQKVEIDRLIELHKKLIDRKIKEYAATQGFDVD